MSHKYNTQKRLSQMLGFTPGQSNNLALNPEGITRANLIKTMFEAIGGIYRMRILGVEFTANGTPTTELNPLDLTVAMAKTGTGIYTITFTEVPTWLQVLSGAANLFPSMELLTLSNTVALSFHFEMSWVSATSTLEVTVTVIDPSDATPVDLDNTDVVVFELKSAS